MALTTRDLNSRIGTEILADKAALLSGEYTAEIRELLERRGVLVFPEVHFTDEEQVAFTRTLGNLAPEMQGEDVYKITLDKKANNRSDYLKGSMYWHIDGTMNKVPILASILSSKVLSPTGGQTQFCNTYAAYDDLSEDEKREYSELRVMHSAWNSLLYYEPEPAHQKLKEMMAIGDNELPLVWEHKSGRKSLVLGCTAYQVLNKPHREGIELLARLREWSTRPELVYSHDWKIGDTVIWDNTGTMHRVTPYDPASGRMLHRTKLEGEEPIT